MAGFAWAERMSGPSGLRRSHDGTSEHVFWLPGAHVAKGAHAAYFFRCGRRVGLENSHRGVVIADVPPVGTPAAELAATIQELVQRNPRKPSKSRAS